MREEHDEQTTTCRNGRKPMNDEPLPPDQPSDAVPPPSQEAAPPPMEAAPLPPAPYRPPAAPLSTATIAPVPAAPLAAAPPPHPGGPSAGPTTFAVDYPEQSSRLWAALFLLFGIKFLVLIVHAIILAVLQIGAFFVFVVAQPWILIAGRMPEGMHHYQTAVIAQGNKMNAWLYGLTDTLPPFFLSDDPYPAETAVGHPAESSRLWALLNIVWLKPLALLPHLIILYVLQIVLMVVVFVAQIAILATGGMPRGMFDFVVGVMRWQTRVNAFLYGLRDEYPAFSLE
jgi:hypothetical protein